MEFFQSWTWMIIMAVLLVALIGLFFYMRSKQGEE
jgi:LPXTG-motif cell wall-anchored protein